MPVGWLQMDRETGNAVSLALSVMGGLALSRPLDRALAVGTTSVELDCPPGWLGVIADGVERLDDPDLDPLVDELRRLAARFSHPSATPWQVDPDAYRVSHGLVNATPAPL